MWVLLREPTKTVPTRCGPVFVDPWVLLATATKRESVAGFMEETEAEAKPESRVGAPMATTTDAEEAMQAYMEKYVEEFVEKQMEESEEKLAAKAASKCRAGAT